MSQLIDAKFTFFFASLLYNNKYSEEYVVKLIEDRFGKAIILRSNYFPMKEYYSKEMGDVNSLSRLLILVPNFYDRRNLVKDKIWSDEVEKNHSDKNLRNINIDVGYQSLEQIVLATGKQFTHRIYLDHGVYTDLNLIFEGSSYKPLNWTYPDYAHSDFINFFNWSRLLLLNNLNNS